MVFGGPEAAAQTRSAPRPGLPIEGYVVVGFAGFTPGRRRAGRHPDRRPRDGRRLARRHRHQGRPADASPGTQALAYARERKTLPDGDFGRSRHQGQLILAAAHQGQARRARSRSPAALTSASKVVHEQPVGRADPHLHRRPAPAQPDCKVGRGVAKGAFGWAGQQSIVVLGDEARGLFADFRDGNLS